MFYRVKRAGGGESDLLGEIWRGETNAVVARFCERGEAELLLARASAGALPARRFAKEFEAYSIGPCLDQARELDVYFREAQSFDETLRGWSCDFLPRLLSTVRALAGGRSVVRPRDPAGREYAPATLRRLPPGGLIPPHFEKEQLLRPPYRHLSTLLDPTTLLSFYLTLAPAESGGEVSVHDFRWSEIDRATWRDDHVSVADLLHSRARITIAPDAGELLIFDGGRFVHQVLPVSGARDRWTLGGFLGFSPDGQNVLVWA